LPRERIQFLTPDEVLAIHERLLQVFGGPPGVRDRGLLESALFRPQTGYYDDLAAIAAALFESLPMNHPFIRPVPSVEFEPIDDGHILVHASHSTRDEEPPEAALITSAALLASSDLVTPRAD
jgi:death-on-curing protein